MISTLNTCWIRLNDRYVKIENIGAIRYDHSNLQLRIYESNGFVSVISATPEQHKMLCKTVGLTSDNVLYMLGITDEKNKI